LTLTADAGTASRRALELPPPPFDSSLVGAYLEMPSCSTPPGALGCLSWSTIDTSTWVGVSCRRVGRHVGPFGRVYLSGQHVRRPATAAAGCVDRCCHGRRPHRAAELDLLRPGDDPLGSGTDPQPAFRARLPAVAFGGKKARAGGAVQTDRCRISCHLIPPPQTASCAGWLVGRLYLSLNTRPSRSRKASSRDLAAAAVCLSFETGARQRRGAGVCLWRRALSPGYVLLSVHGGGPSPGCALSSVYEGLCRPSSGRGNDPTRPPQARVGVGLDGQALLCVEIRAAMSALGFILSSFGGGGTMPESMRVFL
jgi:hypothetical protein